MKITALKTRLMLVALIAIAYSCAQVPFTERKQLMMISEEQEQQIGKATFAQIKEELPINNDPRVNSAVQEVGQRIAKAAEEPGAQWEFIVIEDDSANAFALPGGKVGVFTGIMPIAQNDAGLAVVMGHEIAHVLARHGAERMSQEQILGAGQAALMAAIMGKSPGAREAMVRAYGLSATLGVTLPFSRKHESEADRIGLILMAKAGYDPRAAVDFWKRMAEQSRGASPPELLSTHPGDETRIKRIARDYLPEAMEYYKKALSANPSFNRPAQPVAP